MKTGNCQRDSNLIKEQTTAEDLTNGSSTQRENIEHGGGPQLALNKVVYYRVVQ